MTVRHGTVDAPSDDHALQPQLVPAQ